MEEKKRQLELVKSVMLSIVFKIEGKPNKNGDAVEWY